MMWELLGYLRAEELCLEEKRENLPGEKLGDQTVIERADPVKGPLLICIARGDQQMQVGRDIVSFLFLLLRKLTAPENSDFKSKR